jgi:hypothetical protein
MEMEKGSEFGTIFEGKKLMGLWFSRSEYARDDMKIRAIIAMQKATHGRETDLEDYYAAVNGFCKIEPGPANIGGFLLFFPSMKQR